MSNAGRTVASRAAGVLLFVSLTVSVQAKTYAFEAPWPMSGEVDRIKALMGETNKEVAARDGELAGLKRQVFELYTKSEETADQREKLRLRAERRVLEARALQVTVEKLVRGRESLEQLSGFLGGLAEAQKKCDQEDAFAMCVRDEECSSALKATLKGASNLIALFHDKDDSNAQVVVATFAAMSPRLRQLSADKNGDEFAVQVTRVRELAKELDQQLESISKQYPEDSPLAGQWYLPKATPKESDLFSRWGKF